MGNDESLLSRGKAFAFSVDYLPTEQIGTRFYTDFEYCKSLDTRLGTVGLLATYEPFEFVKFHALCAYKYGNVPVETPWQFSVGLICSFGKKW